MTASEQLAWEGRRGPFAAGTAVLAALLFFGGNIYLSAAVGQQPRGRVQQLVALEREYETDPLILSIAGRKSKLFAELGLESVHDALLGADVTVAVNVGMSATNPQTQVERFFFGLGKLAEILGPGLQAQLNLEEVVKECFGKLGYKDGMRFFQSGGKPNPQMAMLMRRVEELQQQLAAKRNPDLDAAQIKKLEAETERTRGETVGKGVDALFSAMQAAQVVASVPGVTAVADEMLASSGWVDKNGPPLAPPYVGPDLPPPDVDENTSPMFPPRPDSPMEGIETPESQGQGAALPGAPRTQGPIE